MKPRDSIRALMLVHDLRSYHAKAITVAAKLGAITPGTNVHAKLARQLATAEKRFDERSNELRELLKLDKDQQPGG